MDIRSVDLNLLVIFDALARLRSVNRTAEAVGLSQAAASGALARLRRLFGDPLYVRTRVGMEPTPLALQLAPVVREVVQTIESQILQQAGFNPATADRTFTILTPDVGEVAFLPPLIHRLRQEGPNVRLRSLAQPRTAAAEALERGDAELAIGFFPDLQKSNFFQQSLFRTSYTCITCASNTAVASRPTMRQFLGGRHLVVRPDGREHLVDRHLDNKGWHRHVTLEVSHFMSLVALLPQSDLIATVPDEIAAEVQRHISLRRITLPFKPPPIVVQQYWHRRTQNDPGNRWLRRLVYELNSREPSETDDKKLRSNNIP